MIFFYASEEASRKYHKQHPSPRFMWKSCEKEVLVEYMNLGLWNFVSTAYQFSKMHTISYHSLIHCT